MTQEEKRVFLIRRLLDEQPRYRELNIPSDEAEQKNLLRALMNVRPPHPIGEDFLTVQDEYLRAEAAAKGITDVSELTPAEPGIYLWQGDITTLRCGAIVNAANSGMTGCYVPCHGCIDNAIHTCAGVQLSCYISCLELAKQRGIGSVAFCCISTGEFHFPNRLAAEVAVRTVRQYRGDTEVVFNVFKDIDYEIYRELLG